MRLYSPHCSPSLVMSQEGGSEVIGARCGPCNDATLEYPGRPVGVGLAPARVGRVLPDWAITAGYHSENRWPDVTVFMEWCERHMAETQEWWRKLRVTDGE